MLPGHRAWILERLLARVWRIAGTVCPNNEFGWWPARAQKSRTNKQMIVPLSGTGLIPLSMLIVCI